MEHQAKREAGLDGDRRIDWLTAPLSGGRGMPGLNGFFGQPNGDAPPPYQGRVVFRPVRDPVSGLRDFVAAGLIELVGHGSSKRRGIALAPTILPARPTVPNDRLTREVRRVFRPL